MSEMAREAAWLTTEETEVVRARWEGTVLCPEFFRRGKIQTGLLVVAGFVFLAIAVKVAASYSAGAEGFLFFGIAIISLGAIPLARHWERQQELARKPDAELKEGFGIGRGRFVSLIVRQGDAPTGEDRGMLWFEDGRLYFSGHRTSFGLVPAQVSSFATLEAGVPGVLNEVNLVLRRDTPAGPMSISFGLFLSPQTNPAPRLAKLKYDIDDWKSHDAKWRDVAPEEPGQWPPSVAGPGVISDARLLAGALTVSVVLPCLVGGLLWRVSSGGIATIAFCVALLVAAFSPAGSLRWRALRDRRRLGRI